MIPHATQQLSGWGRTPVTECSVYRPESVRAVEAVVGSDEQPNLIARGLGRSYGDASLNDVGGVVLSTRLNRMLKFDADSGVVTCEAGGWGIVSDGGPLSKASRQFHPCCADALPVVCVRRARVLSAIRYANSNVGS